jgi:Acyl-CoA carboxylase epsilon subunit
VADNQGHNQTDQDQESAERMRPSPVLAITAVPYLRVVRGDATAEEIAALVATLSAVAAARSAAAGNAKQRPVRSNWNAPARLLHAPQPPSAGAWRRSSLP